MSGYSRTEILWGAARLCKIVVPYDSRSQEKDRSWMIASGHSSWPLIALANHT